jgi:hypothetical protein
MTMADNDHRTNDLHLTAWSAYILGHHPWTLQLRLAAIQDVSDYHIRVDYPDADCGLLRLELCELDKAYAILLGGKQLKVERTEFLQVFREIDRPLMEMIGASETALAVVPEIWLHRWELLRRLAENAILPDSSAYQWFAFGRSVGRCQSLARTQLFVTDDDNPISADESVARIIDSSLNRLDLTKRGELPEELQVSIQSIVDEPNPAAGAHASLRQLDQRYRNINRLDTQFREWLQQQQAPPVRLVIDKDGIEFFGERKPMKKCSLSEVELLWLLAKTPGMWVERDAFIEELHIGNNDTLKSTISRLKDHILRPLLEKHREERGPAAAPDRADAFILAGGGNTKVTGWTAYKLDLEPAQVQVKVNRQDLHFRK